MGFLHIKEGKSQVVIFIVWNKMTIKIHSKKKKKDEGRMNFI